MQARAQSQRDGSNGAWSHDVWCHQDQSMFLAQSCKVHAANAKSADHYTARLDESVCDAVVSSVRCPYIHTPRHVPSSVEKNGENIIIVARIAL
jgi:hypothetical protein